MMNSGSITSERTHNQSEQDIVIPVIEEQVSIGKSVIATGSVIIKKKVEEDSETVIVPLLHDEHSVEHVPVNVFVDELPSIRYEGDMIVIPVLKEILVKRVLLVEEIRISRQSVQTNEEHTVQLRRETVSVERTTSDHISE